MHTILISITNNYVIRSVLRSDTLPLLAESSDTRIVFLAPETKIGYYRKEFSYPNVVFDRLPSAERSFAERVFKYIEIAGIPTRTAMMQSSAARHREGSRTPWARRIAASYLEMMLRLLGGFAWWRQMVRRLYYLIPSAHYAEVFDRWEPDLVFAPTMLTRDARVLKEAKKRGIATAGMVLSWDNLYSKTMLRVHPDLLLVHTEGIKRQAVDLGDYPPDRIRVVGIPQFDRVVRKTGFIPRDRFLASLGADPSKQLIVYAFSGKAGLSIEFDILEDLYHLRRDGALGEDVEILVRPYPRYDLPPEKLERIKEQYGFRAEPSMAHVGGGKDDWEFDERALDLLVNTLIHADIVITMYSTFFIEGALADKPLIGIAYDGPEPRDYWNSAVRFFEWDHLAAIKPLDGIVLVRSHEELAQAIREYLRNPRMRAAGREKIRAQQCQSMDGASGERAARILLSLVAARV